MPPIPGLREHNYAMERISLDLQEAVIECCGRVFYYKNQLKALLLRSGISEQAYLRYESLEKFKIARNLMGDLDQVGENGIRIQHRLVSEFAKMRTLPYKDVPDPQAAVAALQKLKRLASTSVVVTEEVERQAEERRRVAETRVTTVLDRSKKLNELKERFCELALGKESPQRRGYRLEDVLKELLALSEIEYHPPFKTTTEQIDGWFRYKGTEYLVEDRWRKEAPTKGDLLEFRGKVEGKLGGTRGVFVSIAGFRIEVIEDWDKRSNLIIFVDGRDLMAVLEDRVSFIDALDHKIAKASQEGLPFAPVY